MEYERTAGRTRRVKEQSLTPADFLVDFRHLISSDRVAKAPGCLRNSVSSKLLVPFPDSVFV